MTSDGNGRHPSLSDPESRGGEIARRGFEFQDEVVLSYIPYWLSHEGFAGFIQEAMGDVEVKFFAPGHGYVREFIEIKDHQLTPAEFWKEIDRFEAMHREVAGNYRWFTLVSCGLSKDLHPLMHTLRRLKGAYDFYDPRSSITENTYSSFKKCVLGLGRDEEYARFLFNHTLLISNVCPSPGGNALFLRSIAEHLPCLNLIPMGKLSQIASALNELVARKGIAPVSRLEVEQSFAIVPEAKGLLDSQPIRMNISLHAKTTARKDLLFDWDPFFGGEERRFPPPEEWNERMVGTLLQTREWINECRRKKRILLIGTHRLSAFLALGAVFSAVGGFAVECESRGETWATDAHSDSETPLYTWNMEHSGSGPSKEIAVSIGVRRDIRREVCDDLAGRGLGSISRLHLFSSDPIISAKHGNNAVSSAKQQIIIAARSAGANLMHLYVAGPISFALFLAHRLNGTCDAQVYQWESGTNNYKPSCRLRF
jgi:hypothetical protein